MPSLKDALPTDLQILNELVTKLITTSKVMLECEKNDLVLIIGTEPVALKHPRVPVLGGRPVGETEVP